MKTNVARMSRIIRSPRRLDAGPAGFCRSEFPLHRVRCRSCPSGQLIRVGAWKPRTSGRGGNAAPPFACHPYLKWCHRRSLVSVRMAYKCRAYPTAEQASALNRTFGCVRVVWNRTLAWRHQRYYGDQVKTNFTQANAYLTAMKATGDLAWLNEVPSVPLQQAIRHQQVAYTSFFAKRARPPGSSPDRPPGRGIHPVRVPVPRRRAVPRQDGHAAGVRVVLAGHRPGLD